MPVYKYKTFEEAESALWNFRPDEAYFSRVAELWNFANKASVLQLWGRLKRLYPKRNF